MLVASMTSLPYGPVSWKTNNLGASFARLEMLDTLYRCKPESQQPKALPVAGKDKSAACDCCCAEIARMEQLLGMLAVWPFLLAVCFGFIRVLSQCFHPVISVDTWCSTVLCVLQLLGPVSVLGLLSQACGMFEEAGPQCHVTGSLDSDVQFQTLSSSRRWPFKKLKQHHSPSSQTRSRPNAKLAVP